MQNEATTLPILGLGHEIFQEPTPLNASNFITKSRALIVFFICW